MHGKFLVVLVLEVVVVGVTPQGFGGGGGGGIGMFSPGGRQGQGQPGGGQPGGSQQAGGIAPGRKQKLPPGYANIQGEIMDMSNKVLQRVSATGTNYFRYDDQTGQPVFKRREIDSGKHFVLFPNPIFPPGDGRYVVLRRMRGMVMPGSVPQSVYECFYLSLKDSFHGYVTELKTNEWKVPAGNNAGGFPAAGGMSGG